MNPAAPAYRPAWNAMNGSSALSKANGTAVERAVRYVLNCWSHTVRAVERRSDGAGLATFG